MCHPHILFGSIKHILPKHASFRINNSNFKQLLAARISFNRLPDFILALGHYIGSSIQWLILVNEHCKWSG